MSRNTEHLLAWINKILIEDKTGKYIFILFLSSFMFLFILASRIEFKDYTYPDFANLMTGAHIVKNGQVKDLYVYSVQKTTQESLFNIQQWGLLAYRNLPFTALMLTPLSFFDFMTAYYIFLAFSVFCTYLSIYLLYRYSHLNTNTFLLLSPVLMFTCIYYEPLISGKEGFFLLLVLVVAYLYLLKRQYFRAGAVLTILFIKFNFLIMVPLVFAFLPKIKDKIEFFKGFFIFAFLISVLNIFVYGPSLIFDYPVFLLNSENINHGTPIPTNANLSPLFFYFTSGSESLSLKYLVITNVILYVLFLFLLYFKRSSISFSKLYSIAILLTVALNFHSMYGDLIIYVLAVFLLFFEKDLISRIFSVLLVVSAYSYYHDLNIIIPVIALTYSLYTLLHKPNVT